MSEMKAARLDPELAAALGPIARQEIRRPKIGDIAARRRQMDRLTQLALLAPAVPGVVTVSRPVVGHDGEPVPATWYLPAARPMIGSGAASLYLHGGGMVTGSVAMYDRILRVYVARSAVPILAVDYRLAPEHRHPTPVYDALAGLTAIHDNALTYGIDRDRIAVMGDSAGGGLAAALTHLTRERGGPSISHQILIYPMLDDRTDPPPHHPSAAFHRWTLADDVTGWDALLGDLRADPDLPAWAAPARASDYGGLPPAYLEVGDLDLFAEQDLTYAARLLGAGVPVEFHLHPGAPHAFDLLAPAAGVSQRAMADRVRVLRSL